MNTLILYGSQYGTAKQYAQMLAAQTGLPLSACEDAWAADYEQIVYFGALYAGGVKGLKAAAGRMRRDTRLVLVTVGLADPADRENVEHIRSAARRQLPEELLAHTEFFHLRGGIDYSRLSLKHKTMMALLYNKAKHLPEEKKTAEVRAMIETYGSVVRFVDPDALTAVRNALL